jgi:hypothetical protein
MHALELFVQGEPVNAIEDATGVNRRQLYRWLERGLSRHTEGYVFGFCALQPHSGVAPYAWLKGVVVQGEGSSRGTARPSRSFSSAIPRLERGCACRSSGAACHSARLSPTDGCTADCAACSHSTSLFCRSVVLLAAR